MSRTMTSVVLGLTLIGVTLSGCSSIAPQASASRSVATGAIATLGEVPRSTGYTALAPEVNNQGVREATALIVQGGVTRLVDEQAAP